ncbi:hypothetical protein NPS48_20095, partial [Leclercia pneumoniae]
VAACKLRQSSRHDAVQCCAGSIVFNIFHQRGEQESSTAAVPVCVLPPRCPFSRKRSPDRSRGCCTPPGCG